MRKCRSLVTMGILYCVSAILTVYSGTSLIAYRSVFLRCWMGPASRMWGESNSANRTVFELAEDIMAISTFYRCRWHAILLWAWTGLAVATHDTKTHDNTWHMFVPRRAIFTVPSHALQTWSFPTEALECTVEVRQHGKPRFLFYAIRPEITHSTFTPSTFVIYTLETKMFKLFRILWGFLWGQNKWPRTLIRRK